MVEVQRGYSLRNVRCKFRAVRDGPRPNTRRALFRAWPAGIFGAATVSDHSDPIGGLHKAWFDEVGHAI